LRGPSVKEMQPANRTLSAHATVSLSQFVGALRCGRHCKWLPPRGAAQWAKPSQLAVQYACHGCKCRCCLTLRSRRGPTAWHQAREAVAHIIGLAGLAPHRRSRLTSNVRHQMERPLHFVVGSAALARRALQQPRVVRALFHHPSLKRERSATALAQVVPAGGQLHVLGAWCCRSQSVRWRAALRRALQVATTPRRSAVGKAVPLSREERLQALQATLLPNPSVKARPNGIGPRGAFAYPAPRGPIPSVPPYLKR